MARVARLAWEAVVPHTDGVTESRTDLAPSIEERRPWTTMPESTCHWNAQACVLLTPAARFCARPRWRASRRRCSPAHAEFGRAGDRRHRNGHRSHGSEYKLSHVPLQSLLR